MQPHLVYLANASGAKVGITRRDQEVTRWLDQGAVQGLVIAAAATRHLAGVVETALAGHVRDRTDWRAMVQGDPVSLDLPELRGRLQQAVTLPEGVTWLDGDVQQLSYPVQAWPAAPPARLRLQAGEPVAGRLIGIKGQYLLFEHGVLNVRLHRSYHVRVSASVLPDPEPVHRGDAPAAREQLDLFG